MTARCAGPRRWVSVAVVALAVSGCATVSDMMRRLPRATKPVRYRLAGADVNLRKNLDVGLAHLGDQDYQGALRLLNRALWDLERIESRALRLEELGEALQALADAYTGLRRSNWAADHRRLAAALAEAARQDPGGKAPEASVTRVREAYARALFRDAVTAIGQALVDLEALTHAPGRVKLLEETRCYLAFTYFALEERERAHDELARIAALDASLAFCAREAPPAIGPLIQEVHRAQRAR